MIYVFYIREPDAVLWSYESSDCIDCELPDFTHDEIMAIALDDAGVAQRDEALMQLNKVNKEQGYELIYNREPEKKGNFLHFISRNYCFLGS